MVSSFVICSQLWTKYLNLPPLKLFLVLAMLDFHLVTSSSAICRNSLVIDCSGFRSRIGWIGSGDFCSPNCVGLGVSWEESWTGGPPVCHVPLKKDGLVSEKYFWSCYHCNQISGKFQSAGNLQMIWQIWQFFFFFFWIYSFSRPSPKIWAVTGRSIFATLLYCTSIWGLRRVRREWVEKSEKSMKYKLLV